MFGVPHDKWGETPLAEMILDDGANLDAKAVIGACADQLGSYKKAGPGRLPHRAVPAQPSRQAPAQSDPGAVLGRARPPGGRLIDTARR